MSHSDQQAVTQREAAASPAAKPLASATPVPAPPPAPIPAPIPAPPPAPTPARSTGEIERDIEATRERLAASIDELTNRVSPKNVAMRGVDKARLTVIDETGAPRTTRLAAVGAAVVAVVGLVLWRRRG